MAAGDISSIQRARQRHGPSSQPLAAVAKGVVLDPRRRPTQVKARSSPSKERNAAAVRTIEKAFLVVVEPAKEFKRACARKTRCDEGPSGFEATKKALRGAFG